jgi:hypothetical protein
MAYRQTGSLDWRFFKLINQRAKHQQIATT